MERQILDCIGNTPLVKITHLDTGPCELFVKLEALNPGGSIKDRIALEMVNQAEQDGLLKPGATLVEATAGNTGLGLAFVAAQKGYNMLLVIPDKMSQEKIFNLRAMGAEVVLTRSDVAKGHPEYYQDVAERIAKNTPNTFYVNQFNNPANVAAHYKTTGPEIWQQMSGQLDAVVCGVGSGGTITGVGSYLKEQDPNVEMILADPEGSILADYINKGEMNEPGSWMVEGIGEDFIPGICDINLAKEAYTISDEESFRIARELLRKEGIMGGSSSGTLVAAALRYCRCQKTPKRVVTFICDSGNRYLSKMYNDYWMLEQGFIQRDLHDDLRDLISRPYNSKETIIVTPNEPLLTAYSRMQLYDVSQLPVIEHDKIVGIIDEADILLAVHKQESHFKNPVKSAMVTDLKTIDYRATMRDLYPIFEQNLTAIIMDGGAFLGLVTRMDLLKYLRNQI